MILVIMEAVYVMTGREIWKRMTRFWGPAVRYQLRHGSCHRHHHGVPVRHQLGLPTPTTSVTSSAHRSPSRALVAFFLEATFVGLFFFGWERLTRVGASGGDRAGGARLEPLGAVGSHRQRLDAAPGRRASSTPGRCAWSCCPSATCCSIRWRRRSSVHTAAAGYVVGSVFVLAVSAWYLLRGRPQRRYREALDGGRGELWPRLRALGGRARG